MKELKLILRHSWQYQWMVIQWMVVVLILALASTAQAVDYNDVATGNWGTSTTWSPAGIPGSGDNVVIDSHTVTLDAAQSVNYITELPKNKVKVEKDLLEKAVYLDKLYIPTRYPNGFESGASADFYTAKEAREAIENAEVILSFVKAQIR